MIYNIYVYFESRLTASEHTSWRLYSSHPDKLAPRCPGSIAMFLLLRCVWLCYLYLRRVCLRYLYLHRVCLAKYKCSKPRIRAGDRFKKGAVLRGENKISICFVDSICRFHNLHLLAVQFEHCIALLWFFSSCRSRCSHCALCFVCLVIDL